MPVWHDYQMLGDENHANQHMDSYPVSMEDLSSKIISWTQGIRTDANYLLYDYYFSEYCWSKFQTLNAWKSTPFYSTIFKLGKNALSNGYYKRGS